MAASHRMVEPLVSRLEQLVNQADFTLPHPDAQIFEVTNKRVFIWCPDRVSSKNLSLRIKNEGYSLEVRKGLKTSAYYIQVFL